MKTQLRGRSLFVRCGLSASGILCSVLLSGNEAQALTAAQLKCREVVSRLTRGTLRTAVDVRVNCSRRKAYGTLDPTVDCQADPEELGGIGTGDLATDRRLAKLAFSGVRTGIVFSNHCSSDVPELDVLPSDIGVDDACSPPSEDWNEVGQCLVDLGMQAALLYVPALDLQGPGPLSLAALACMDAVDQQARRSLGTSTSARSLCFSRDDRLATDGGVLDCGATVMPPGITESTGDEKIDARLSRAFPRLEASLEQHCDITLSSVGYDQITPDVTGGRFEGRITLFDVSEHLNDRLQETVHMVTFGDTGVEGLFLGSQTGGFCGDGTRDSGEECDDGNNFSCDGCDRDCTLPVCGNGAVCDDEECDDGNNVSGDGCSAICVSEICGNGIVNPGYAEECDDAGFSATCDDDCSLAICGDTLVNPVAGETCDEGSGLPDNTPLNTPTCDSDCSAPACPDGHFNPFNTNAPAPAGGEQCDDGGNSMTCDADCTDASCGDGYVNPVRGEQCDDANFIDTDACPSSSSVPGSFCANAFCGDGFTRTAVEFCDDGNGTPGSAESGTCDNDCTAVVCGDSNRNVSAGEQCDNGGANGNSRRCTGTCKNAVCGDALTCSDVACTTGPSGGPEGCDDANGDNNDRCRNDCGNATCGDGVLCSDAACTSGPGAGPEECDTSGQSATCDSDCSAAGCGDSQANAAAGETCDTGGASPTCDADCTAVSCGDGTVNIPALEQCDSGASNGNTRPCTSTCHVAYCGDLLVCSNASCTSGPGGGPESCDGGGETFSCDSDCSTAICGDSQINVTRGEQCDNGGSNGNTRPCTATCHDAYCGDGLTCSNGSCTSGPGGGVEQCDGAGESFSCDSDCSTAFCGDSQVNPTRGEACDQGGLNGSGSGFCLGDCSGIQP